MHARKLAKAFGYLYAAEIEALLHFCSLLPPNPVIVNIGAGSGTSGLLFLESRGDSVVHTIDVTDKSSPYGSLESERVAVKSAGLDFLAGTRWFQHHGDSKEVGKTWTIELDMVFIDGNHTYEGCKGDLDIWVPHIKKGGIVAIHDYGKAQNDPTADGRTKAYPGVDQAVQEFVDAHHPHFIQWADTLIGFAV